MNRAMCLTVLSMLASVAAAVAAPGEPLAVARDDAQRVAVVAGPRPVEAGVSQPPRRAPSLGEASRCGPDAAAPYRQWHHGGLKVAPGCAAASRG